MSHDTNLQPHDIDAEECVLGAAMLGDAYEENYIGALGGLNASDFYRERNGWIWAAIVGIHQRGDKADQVIVGSQLSEQGRLSEIGGPAYLSLLVSRVPTPFLGPQYAERVREMAKRRRQIVDGMKQVQEGYTGTSKPAVKPVYAQPHDPAHLL